MHVCLCARGLCQAGSRYAVDVPPSTALWERRPLLFVLTTPFMQPFCICQRCIERMIQAYDELPYLRYINFDVRAPAVISCPSFPASIDVPRWVHLDVLSVLKSVCPS
jgi:hypothetical protein